MKIIFKIGISTFFIFLILRDIDIQSIKVQLSNVNIMFIPLIIMFLIANYFISSVRWKALLIHKNSENVTVWYLTALYFIGAFFNNFMPTSVGGDVFKIYKLGKKLNNTVDAFSATFMERFTGIIALVLISSFGLVKLLGFYGVLILVTFILGIPLGYIFLGILSKKVKIKKLSEIYESIKVYVGRWDVLLVAFFTSFLVQLISIFTQYFIFTSLGINLPIAYSLFAFPVITLATFFLPSLNGVGVQDSMYRSMFLIIGVDPILSLSASILYHVFRLLVSLVGGLLYAMGKDD